MLLYFSIVGGLIYKIFVATPKEHDKEGTMHPTQLTMAKHKAADLNIG